MSFEQEQYPWEIKYSIRLSICKPAIFLFCEVEYMVEYMSVLRLRSRNSVGASSSQTLTQETWQRILPHHGAGAVDIRAAQNADDGDYDPVDQPTTEINEYTSLFIAAQNADDGDY